MNEQDKRIQRKRKLTYWVSECLNDSRAYSIRGRRKKDVVAELESIGLSSKGGKAPGPFSVEYGPVRKVEVSYEDPFDLLSQCLDEGRGSWEVEW